MVCVDCSRPVGRGARSMSQKRGCREGIWLVVADEVFPLNRNLPSLNVAKLQRFEVSKVQSPKFHWSKF